MDVEYLCEVEAIEQPEACCRPRLDIEESGAWVNLRGCGDPSEGYEQSGGQCRITTSELPRLREALPNGRVAVCIPRRLPNPVKKPADRVTT
jgi:hypothetical protein